jgi:hypothetical protein
VGDPSLARLRWRGESAAPLAPAIGHACNTGSDQQQSGWLRDGGRRLEGVALLVLVAQRDRTIKALVTFHPAYLLRSPLEKRHAWRDFLALKKALNAPSS